MLVTGFPADVFGTNCYLVAAEAGQPCLVVDPGIGVGERLRQQLTRHRLRPAAVLLTHGHLDHTGSAASICREWDSPALIHPADRELLADPAKGLSAELARLLPAAGPFPAPERVVECADGASFRLAGLEITVFHAPGHTPGSVLFHLPAPDQSWELLPAPGAGVAGPAGSAVCFTGDVLFAGAIGRTDLPGGSAPAMQASLRDKILSLADDTVVLPGHGPDSTVGRERATNPYLRLAASGSD